MLLRLQRQKTNQQFSHDASVQQWFADQERARQEMVNPTTPDDILLQFMQQLEQQMNEIVGTQLQGWEGKKRVKR